MTPAPPSWGPWSLDSETYVLWLADRRVLGGRAYEVDLERCRTAGEVLDWILQIAGKVWAEEDPRVVTGLVHALDAVLGGQGALCPFGASPRRSRAAIRRCVDAFLREGRRARGALTVQFATERRR
ncbi:MAG TPA: hypothetical protein VGF25_19755 [Thermoleophilaceae bacterium]|jgi:hypothetical protein